MTECGQTNTEISYLVSIQGMIFCFAKTWGWGWGQCKQTGHLQALKNVEQGAHWRSPATGLLSLIHPVPGEGPEAEFLHRDPAIAGPSESTSHPCLLPDFALMYGPAAVGFLTADTNA